MISLEKREISRQRVLSIFPIAFVLFLYKLIRHFVFVFVFVFVFYFVCLFVCLFFLTQIFLQIPNLLVYLIILLYLAEMPVYMREENRKHQQQQEIHDYKSGDRIRS